MLGKVLSTSVDDLVDFVKSKKVCSIEDITTKFNIPIEIVDRWLVILEEFQILKVNYSGFSGSVKYIEKEDKKNNLIDVENLRDEFIKRAKLKNLRDEKIKVAWSDFIIKFEKKIKEDFFILAEKKGFNENVKENAWLKYKEVLYKY